MGEAKHPVASDRDGAYGEPLANELWRFWAKDIRPYFAAEADFLRKYGADAGYEDRYIARVLDDHRLLEELVWTQGGEGVRHFAGLLAAHIRFKEEYFKERVRQIVEDRTPTVEGWEDGFSGHGA